MTSQVGNQNVLPCTSPKRKRRGGQNLERRGRQNPALALRAGKQFILHSHLDCRAGNMFPRLASRRSLGEAQTKSREATLCFFLDKLCQEFSLSQPAASGSAGRRAGIAIHGQRSARRLRFCRHTQQPLQFLTVTFRTLHRFSIEDERLKRVVTLLTCIFIHRHVLSPRYERRRL